MQFKNLEKRPRIIAIEGLDGAGKSSLCEQLSIMLAEYDGRAVKTPSGVFLNLLDNHIDADRPSKFFRYLLADVAIRHQFGEYSWLVIDRYILSTLAYHLKYLIHHEKEIAEALSDLSLPSAEATFILHANAALIEKRLSSRGEDKGQIRDTLLIEQAYQVVINRDDFKPWLGEVVFLRSETPEDRASAIQAVIEFIEQNHNTN